MDRAQELQKQILELTKEYYNETYGKNKTFEEGDHIAYSGRVFDAEEMTALVDSSLDFWLTAGKYANEFEEKLANYMGLKYCSLVNSGSSANLLAFMTLTAQELGERRIRRGDEVITVAAGFPTTITPIIQYGAIPVFLDVTIPQYNIDVSRLEEAVTVKTKAVFLAHTLGNPFDIAAIKEFCKKHNLWLIEDNCDALGSLYYYKGKWKKTGTFGDLATSSFYPPHHITLGEGGAVYTDNPLLARLVNSFRDWGRDCWCKPGIDDTCRHRFTQQFGELPSGYDHKYVYSHFGYNLKATDMQAAVGCSQLKKLEQFVTIRKENWKILKEGLKELEDVLILPTAEKHSDPSWFGFLMTVKNDAGFTRDELSNYLESKHIQTRNLFAGNFIKHPCFDEMRTKQEGYRTVGTLKNTDQIMNQTLWIGVYPGMNQAKLDYMITSIKTFVGGKKHDTKS